jgi:hypothetical protein
MRKQACLIPNPDHEPRKTKTQLVQNKNPTIFYCKNETRNMNKVVTKKNPKLVLNKLKVI